MLTEPLSLETGRSLHASCTHHRSFPDLPAAPLPAPSFRSVSEGTHNTVSMHLPLGQPHPCRCLCRCSQLLSKLQVSFWIPETTFRYLPRRRPPTEPFSPPSFSATSGIDQFSTKIKEVDECTSNCLFCAFSLITLSSSAFCASSTFWASSAFCACSTFCASSTFRA